MFCGRRHQRPATLARHGHRGRYLVAWRDVDPVATCKPAIDTQPVFIDALRSDPGIAILEQPPQPKVSGFLDPDRRGPIRQQLTDNVEAVLRAERDEYFVRTRLDTTTGEKFGTNLMHQHRIVSIDAAR